MVVREREFGGHSVGILGGKWAEREAAAELGAFRGSVEAQRGSFVPSARRLDPLQKETHR